MWWNGQHPTPHVLSTALYYYFLVFSSGGNFDFDIVPSPSPLPRACTDTALDYTTDMDCGGDPKPLLFFSPPFSFMSGLFRFIIILSLFFSLRIRGIASPRNRTYISQWATEQAIQRGRRATRESCHRACACGHMGWRHVDVYPTTLRLGVYTCREPQQS